MKVTPEQRTAIHKLKFLLYQLGIKSAKPGFNYMDLNLLFKEVYGVTGISDLAMGQPSPLFGIDPTTYSKWKSNGKSNKK